MKQDIKNNILKYWKDPVWSKVIATIIIAFGSSIVLTVVALTKSKISKVPFKLVFSQIVNYFKSTIELNNLIFWLIILVLTVFLISLIKSKIKYTHKREEKANEDTSQPPDIDCSSTVLFSRRISDAFPGQRGIATFYNKKAINRLQILLRKPLIFNPVGHGSMAKPIWWFRGDGSCYIDSFRQLSKSKVLMNVEELLITKIVVVIRKIYKESYIYVETKGDKQIGLNNYTAEDVKRSISDFGYCKEEFGLYNKIPITRQEYDDGSAEIKNKVVETKNAELRVRYISKYNFIIAAKQSPFNSTDFDIFSEPKFNEILKGNLNIESFIDEIDDYLQQIRR